MNMPSRNGRARLTLAWAFLAGLFALGLFAAPVNAADRAKTLRVVLTSAEMSFDPQFSADAGSDGIIDHIYDSMLDYDYLDQLWNAHRSRRGDWSLQLWSFYNVSAWYDFWIAGRALG